MAGFSRSLSRSTTVSAPTRGNFKIPISDLRENDDNAPSFGSGSGSARSLMDIIREEQAMRGSGSIRDAGNGNINWKAFKDRIRLRRAAHAFESDPDNPRERENIVEEYNPNPNPDPNPNPESGSSNEEAGSGNGEPVTMSLMALLGEGGGFGSFADPDAGLEDEDEGEGEDDGEEGGEYVCCVCMVRHKGAAFIPCGHTFCRLCSRELWVSRGNCPLCNGFILEILDIF